MKVRLGYACINKTLDITTSSTYQYNKFMVDNDMEKLYKIIEKNLLNLECIIDYNIRNHIYFYRISSNIIPLATVADINYDKFADIFKRIGLKIKENNLRVDMHTSEFCVLNSVKGDVVEESIKIIKYHYKILDLLSIEDKVIILHIGSSAFGKKASLTRFINNFNLLDADIKKSIVVENDDKVFNVLDCIYLHEKIGVRIVLDYHHYICNSGDILIDDYLDILFEGWKVPKIHFSSPKSHLKKEFRSHSEYINPLDFIKFIGILYRSQYANFDIMLEAKGYDDAIYRLVGLLKYYNLYKFIDEGSFEV